MLSLDQAVPCDRSFDDYTAMFALTPADMASLVLGCGDGPASFNAEASRRGADFVACDPLYRFSRAEIDSRIAATNEQVIEQIRQNQKDFVWEAIPSLEEFGQKSMDPIRAFLDAYPKGIQRSGI